MRNAGAAVHEHLPRRRADWRPHHRRRAAQMERFPRFPGGKDVQCGAGVCVPVHQGAARRQEQRVLEVHGRRDFQGADAADAGQNRQRDGCHLRADGAPAKRGHPRRRIRISAEQAGDGGSQRAVPHTAPHHPHDGGHDGAARGRNHLRPGMRHIRLSGGGERVPESKPQAGSPLQSAEQGALHEQHVPRLRHGPHHAAHRRDEHDDPRRG